MKTITKYLCSKCGEEFHHPEVCKQHEVTCTAQNCEMCEHFERFDGGRERCFYSLIGRECEFELREQSK